MKIYRDLTKIKNTCLGLGFFDGVHIGHAKLLTKLKELSLKTNSKSIIVTMQRNPAEVFSTQKSISYITTQEEKEHFFSNFGIDYVIELKVNNNLINMSAEDYIKKVLYEYFSPNYIISGFNHTFGKNKMGTPVLLKENQDKYNYKYIEMPEVKFHNETVSSTLIRNELIQGNIKKANSLLGYAYKISGKVIKGNQLGRTIGFPTANIEYPELKVKIPFGVYSTEVLINKTTHKGILNYGIKPTINKDCKPVAEVHIIGFNDDIYGNDIEINILDKIRDEKKFNSLNELKQQISEDLKKC